MPKYELMYILSSAVSDNDVPSISTEVDKFIADSGGKLLTQEMLGKKKLAYPIKKTRNGFYVLETFNFESRKVKDLDDKLRSIDSIIRYIVVNVEDMELRAAKDRKIQEKMRAARKPQKVEGPVAAPEVADIKITDTELEQKIEKALESDDLTK
ncbi:MAG TPA: 30S ribosomal protein S6 [Verrucomicrobiae bacterium]|nr:30S ribosomal protein S6 [Verrucomicrobiae bacterium]